MSGGAEQRRVAVFGAAGWVGRAILANLSGRHRVRAFDRSPDSWAALQDMDGDWREGEVVHGDIADFAAVDAALEGMDAVIHAAVYGAPGGYGVDDDLPFLVNLKGLWNVLEAARLRQIRRVVHIGSCQVVHPKGVFFTADVRRPDGSLYAVTKRLQEEMCRQFHEAFDLPIVVLRPCSIVDSRLGIGKSGAPLDRWSESWVCRHDLAEACRLAVERLALTFEVLHMAGPIEAAAHCDARRAVAVLGLQYRGDFDRFR